MATERSSLASLFPASTGTASPIPAVVDGYRVLRPLGRGGTGVVFEAEDTSLGRRVALKLMPDAAGQDWRRACQRRLMSAPPHPNVVALHRAGAYAGGVYLVMELVEGPSLQGLLGAGGVYWREATELLAGACAGAAALHARGIIHCDIKPANLLRATDGVVKLTDYGLARALGRTAEGGTPHYMSPEQCRAEPVDERADVYALGATYHALLTGRTPYGGASWQVLFAHCSAPPPDPRAWGRDIPRVCAEIVGRAMAKKRADRYDSAHDLWRALGFATKKGTVPFERDSPLFRCKARALRAALDRRS